MTTTRGGRAFDDRRREGIHRTSIERGDTDAYLNLAILLVDSGRLDEAEKLLWEGVDLGAKRVVVGLAYLRHVQGRYEEAVALYGDLDDEPSSALYGSILHKAGCFERSVTVLEPIEEPGIVPFMDLQLSRLALPGRPDMAEAVVRDHDGDLLAPGCDTPLMWLGLGIGGDRARRRWMARHRREIRWGCPLRTSLVEELLRQRRFAEVLVIAHRARALRDRRLQHLAGRAHLALRRADGRLGHAT